MEHIGPFANELTRRGHSCTVAVEANDTLTIPTSNRSLYQVIHHGDLIDKECSFPNGNPADIVHAWTPREIVRQIAVGYIKRHVAARLIVHLEDNEESIIENVYQNDATQLLKEARENTERAWNIRLSHPLEYKRFLASADAISLITSTLHRSLPISKETITLPPIVDPIPSAIGTDKEAILKKHQIPEGRKLIIYPGGVSSNNREDIRNLYLAAKLLQEAGTPALVIKTGPNCEILEESFTFHLNDIRLDLGYVSEQSISELLSIADLLVQPGLDNPFNRDRFPCKIPKFLASGRPCILPSFYLLDTPGSSGTFLPLLKSSPEEIANLASKVFNNHELSSELGKKAQAFANLAFAPERAGDELERLYLRARQSSRTANLKIREDLEEHIKLLSTEKADLQAAINQLEANKAALLNALSTEQQKTKLQQADIEGLRRKLEQRIAREIRRSKSVSWQITMPLRFLRRKLIDPFTKDTPPPPKLLKSIPADRAAPITREETSATTIQEEACEEKTSPPAGHPIFDRNYHLFLKWEAKHVTTYLDNYKHPPEGPESPKISLLLPVYDVAETWLRRCLDSIIAQRYQNWELCIADDCSTKPHIKLVLEEYRANEPRIRIVFRKTNGHISAATNSAFELATGDYIGLVDHDDELRPHSLARFIDTISQNPHAKLIYSDQDKVDENGWRFGPHFKPDWNYDLLLGCNMVQQLSLYRRDVYESEGGMKEGFEGAQDWDLTLRVSENCEETEIIHIPEVLYHWRAIPGSTAKSINFKDYAHQAQKKAISAHLQRIGMKAKLESINGIHWRVIRELPISLPTVTVIIPFKDEVEDLKDCIQSIISKTTYPNYHILLVDNNSEKPETANYIKSLHDKPRIKIKKDKTSPFNYSKINNTAIYNTTSELICLLNSDTEIITKDWLQEMVSHAIRPEIGAVGARLLYPNNHVQHAGVILGLGGVADHACKHLHKDDPAHMYRSLLTGCYSAVTGACMLFKKSHWETIGGLDEDNLAVSFNDTDFCLKLRESGLKIIYTPFAQLYHKESKTRGDTQAPDKLAVFHREASHMYQHWPKVIWRDPYYNPNFSKETQDYSYIH